MYQVVSTKYLYITETYAVNLSYVVFIIIKYFKLTVFEG